MRKKLHVFEYRSSNNVCNFGYVLGAKVADDSRSKSSADVRDAESPSGDKRKSGGIWGTFKKSARRLRSRSREKSGNRKSRLSSSQPDLSDGGSPTNADDENPFERRNDDSMTNGVTSEGDSGIAVVDQSVSAIFKISVFLHHIYLFQLHRHYCELWSPLYVVGFYIDTMAAAIMLTSCTDAVFSSPLSQLPPQQIPTSHPLSCVL